MTRDEAREFVWIRAQGRCEWPTCRRALTMATMHAHELVFRSAGGDDTDPANILALCGGCHLDLHVRLGGTRKRIDHAGAGYGSSLLRFWERPSSRDLWREVSRYETGYSSSAR